MSDAESIIKGIFGGIIVMIGFVLLLYPIALILWRGSGFFWGIILLILLTIPAGIFMFVGARLMRKSAKVSVVQTVGGGNQGLSCPECGTRCPPGTKFCPECGSKLVR